MWRSLEEVFLESRVQGKKIMKKELDEKLCADFPLIFKNRHASPRQSAFAFGFECGDGWYWLIDKLCNLLMWDGKTGKERTNPPIAAQVKEKFGSLRFYVGGADDKQHNFIEMAEYLSGSICETCGTTEEVFQTKGWIRTTCPDCENDRVKAIDNS